MTSNLDKKVAELFEAGSHLGHKTNRVHPKAKKYIYSVENGVSIIDLTKTVPLFEKAKEFVKKEAEADKTMLVVATKKVSTAFIAKLCKEKLIPFITLKWPAGLLTNFDMISKNVKKLTAMKEAKDKGEWSKYVKHEQVNLQKELNKLERFYGGIEMMRKIPDFIFVVDIKKEKNAVKESTEMKLPIVAIADTNVDPDIVDYPIPGNDDSATSIEYFVKEIIETYSKSKAQASNDKANPKSK